MQAERAQNAKGQGAMEDEDQSHWKTEHRAKEAAKLGFDHLIAPAANKLGSGSMAAGLTVSALQSVSELYALISDFRAEV